MKLVTIATHSDGYFEYLKKSCERLNSELIVLGWGQKWTGYSFKSQLLQSFLKDLPDDEVVCCIDSFDVVLLRSAGELEKSFREFSEITGAKVVVGFDRFSSELMKTAAKIQFGMCYGYHVNAGTYMGYAKELKEMIDAIYLDPKLDDQRLLTSYCRKYPNKTHIDSASIFFLTIHNTFGDGFYDPNIMEIDSSSRLWFRGVRPFFAHGNGNTDMNSLIEKLGYPMNQEEKKRLQLFNRKAKVKKTKWYLAEFVERYNYMLLLCLLFLVFVFLLKRSATKSR